MRLEAPGPPRTAGLAGPSGALEEAVGGGEEGVLLAAGELLDEFEAAEDAATLGAGAAGPRYYASSLGRFMTPDWSASPEAVPFANLDNPQSLNLYSYFLNNPVTNTDADGHICIFGWGTCSAKAKPKLPVKEGGVDEFLGKLVKPYKTAANSVVKSYTQAAKAVSNSAEKDPVMFALALIPGEGEFAVAEGLPRPLRMRLYTEPKGWQSVR